MFYMCLIYTNIFIYNICVLRFPYLIYVEILITVFPLEMGKTSRGYALQLFSLVSVCLTQCPNALLIFLNVLHKGGTSFLCFMSSLSILSTVFYEAI